MSVELISVLIAVLAIGATLAGLILTSNRGLRKDMRAAAGLLLACAALVAEPTPTLAQTKTLVSNTGQGEDDSAPANSPRAQRFTTGSHTLGYILTSVDIVTEHLEGDSFTLAVYTVNASGYPDTLHASLTAPSSFAAGTLVFTAPSGTTLAANTSYTVVLTPTDLVRLDSTSADGEDSGGATGWSIADTYDFKSPGAASWVSLSPARVIVVDVFA